MVTVPTFLMSSFSGQSALRKIRSSPGWGSGEDVPLMLGRPGLGAGWAGREQGRASHGRPALTIICCYPRLSAGEDPAV